MILLGMFEEIEPIPGLWSGATAIPGGFDALFLGRLRKNTFEPRIHTDEHR
jgi:hypothetical protein